jgi:hypothetical protein
MASAKQCKNPTTCYCDIRIRTIIKERRLETLFACHLYDKRTTEVSCTEGYLMFLAKVFVFKVSKLTSFS